MSGKSRKRAHESTDSEVAAELAAAIAAAAGGNDGQPPRKMPEIEKRYVCAKIGPNGIDHVSGA